MVSIFDIKKYNIDRNSLKCNLNIMKYVQNVNYSVNGTLYKDIVFMDLENILFVKDGNF